MKPESWLGIALELIETTLAPGPFPADARVGRFFRARRFLGSRDRRFLGNAVYAWLRHFPRARLRWTTWATQCDAPSLEDSLAVDPRVAILCEVVALAADKLFPWSLEDTTGAAHGVKWRSTAASHLVEKALDRVETGPFLTPDSHWPQSDTERRAARMSLPVWLADRLVEDYGEEKAGALATAFMDEGTVDLRVHQRRVSREKARKQLEKDINKTIELTPWSPLGLRLKGRQNLTGTTVNRRGWIEVADEGSQVVALALDAEPGMTIVDACAGAGGKTLILADVLLGTEHEKDALGVWSRTRLIACDISSRRLEELARRAREAHIEEWLDTVPVDEEGPLPESLPESDLILVDAPCSGFGTIRRNPDLKLRYEAQDCAAFGEAQKRLLERYAPLVKPGGRLAYSACSILAVETEEVARAFEAAHPEFEPYRSTWAIKRLPAGCLDGNRVRLDPVLTATDGFFLAQWTRVKE